MKTTDNSGGGKTVILVQGDQLNSVPKTHGHLLSDRIHAAFADVPAYLRQLSRRCPFPSMAQWLEGMALEGTWSLDLCQGFSTDYWLAGFALRHKSLRGALLAPACESPLPQLPASLADFYRLVDQISWGGFGSAGGISSPVRHHPISNLDFDFHGDVVDIDDTYTWGESSCGDMLIYSEEGRGGWLNHETHEIILRNSIWEVVEEIFTTMLSGGTPDLKRCGD